MSYYRTQLEDWLKTIDVNAERVLDLGGASNPVRKRVRSWDVNECVFFDLGKENAVVEYMPFDINLPINQLKGYFSSLENKSTFKFDAIFCLEVFEYVWNPVQAIQNIWDLMSNDSVVYISFPAVYPVHNPVEIDYLRYTRQAISKYLGMFEFSKIEIVPRVATEGRHYLANFYGQEKMHPVKGSQLPYDIGYMVKARKLVNYQL